jgi:hypothetical protein
VVIAGPQWNGDPNALHVATGVFVQYRLVKDGTVSRRMTIRTDGGALRTFELSPDATIDGLRFICIGGPAPERYCSSPPSGFKSGTTRVALQYWTQPAWSNAIWTGVCDRSSAVRTMALLEEADTGDLLGWFYRMRSGGAYFRPALTFGVVNSGDVRSIFVQAGDGVGIPAIAVREPSASEAARAVRALFERFTVTGERHAPQQFWRLANERAAVRIEACN